MLKSFLPALAIVSFAGLANAATTPAPKKLAPAVRAKIMESAKADPSWSAWVKPALKVTAAATANKTTYKYTVAITARMTAGPVTPSGHTNSARFDVMSAKFTAKFPGAKVTQQGAWKQLPLPMFALGTP